MLNDALSATVSYAASIAVLALVAYALTAAVFWLTRLRPRLMRRPIARVLREIRRYNYHRLGLRPSPPRLRAQILRESTTLLARDQLAAEAGFRPRLPRWYPMPESVAPGNRLLEALFCDLEAPEIARLRSRLDDLTEPLRRRTRLWTLVLTISVSLALAIGFRLSALSLPDAIATGEPLWLDDRSLFNTGFFVTGTVQWGNVAGVGLSAVFAMLMAQALLRRTFDSFDRSAARMLRHSDEHVGTIEDAPGDEPPIGRNEAAVRAINFSGVAFDSFMQLGVAHALVTISGRAPDVVVGMSSGAVHAVGLAEVLQAGQDGEIEALLHPGKAEEPDSDEALETSCRNKWREATPAEQLRIHNQRLLARVSKLREFIDAAVQAPRRLVDAVLPDVYQVDSSDPIAPLEQPRFSPKERAQRAEATRRRSGLVRLYNDILGIPFSIGTITRILRRFLGLWAASEIRQASARVLVRVAEVFRLWVLLGVNLFRAVPVVSLLIRILVPGHRTRIVNAGALVFRFRAVNATLMGGLHFISFLILVTFWSAVSLVFLTFGQIVWWACSDTNVVWTMLVVPPLYGLVTLLWSRVAHGGSEVDRRNMEIAGLDIFKAFTVFVTATVVWGAIAVVLLVAARYGTNPAPVVDHLRWGVRALLMAGGAFALMILAVVLWARQPGNARRAILGYYDLSDSLFKEHWLRAYLVELFDPGYYGEADYDRIVEASLSDERRGTRGSGTGEHGKRRLSFYADRRTRLEPIEVGVAVADASSGKLCTLPVGTAVVKGLLAAVSVSPLLPPVEIDGVLYVDGTNVTREPNSALLRLLRRRLNPESKVVHIYSVSPLPVTCPELPARRYDGRDGEQAEGEILLNLVDVVANALRLQRFRDATLERRLTELFNRVIPSDRAVVELPVGDGRVEKYFRAWVTPIELESDMSLTRRILRAPAEQRRQAILEAVADGCRASLQVMIPESIEATAKRNELAPWLRQHGQGRIAGCAHAVRHHLQHRNVENAEILNTRLPGSDPRLGPGLSEICRHCRLWRDPIQAPASLDDATRRSLQAAADKHGGQALRLGEQYQGRGPAWPHEREEGAEDLADDPHFELKDPPDKAATMEALAGLRSEQESMKPEDRWPEPVDSHKPGNRRPTVSFLFSGGVFRGVYQMGVLNALNLLGMKPDIIAGASVGSITAAMIARVFSIGPGEARDSRIARLAAVYLAVDRLILTDRFADFVRNFTLRAADTRFSIRQMDRLLRKYDYPKLAEFDSNARKVLAGIERLLYVNPYQFNELVRALRCRDVKRSGQLLRHFAQQLLDRFQIGGEALGSEPLRELIHAYVLREHDADTFDDFRDGRIQLLATTTNLTRGRLEILGERPVPKEQRTGDAPQLMEGLLASSAFPGVFQPRWSWNLTRSSNLEHQYIDGGVMDNLPIDAVAQYLHRASQTELIAPRPESPHLAIAASLQVRTPPFKLPATRAEFLRNWPALLRRTGELSYNSKLDRYCAAERRLQEVRACPDVPPAGVDLLSLQVMAIKPNWLPSTFGVHPMLGFRRQKQCKSIAHGCASTLLTFATEIKLGNIAKHIANWRVKRTLFEDDLPSHWAEAFERFELKQARGKHESGKCWLLKNCTCPFSREALRPGKTGSTAASEGGDRLPDRTVDALAEIHAACLRRETHLREI